MSQKTNPLSLRLQKSNQNFSSPWFSDYFFNENFHYQFSIEKYISSLLKESHYSKAFFSAKNDYRKSNIFLVIQDIRAQRKEKMLSFNLKQNRSLSKYITSYKNCTFEEASLFALQKTKENGEKQMLLLNAEEKLYNAFNHNLPEILLKKKIKKNFREKPLIKADFLKNLLVAQQKIKIENREKSKEIKRLSAYNSNLKAEASCQRQNLRCQLRFFSPFFRKNIRNDFLKYKQNYNLAFSSYIYNYLDFFAERYNFHKKENNLKQWWEIYWQDNIRTNSCLSFSEKTVNGSFFIPSSQTSVPFFSLNKDGDKERFIDSNRFDLIAEKRCISPNFLTLSERQKRGTKTKKTNKDSTSFFPITTYFEPIRFIDDVQNVKALLDNVVALIEKRVSFGQIKSKLFEDLSKNLQIKGVRISCSGRLGGRSKKAQKAKLQSDQWGATSLNAFSSKVLFARKSAYTSYGKVGVKIWLSFKT